MDIRLPDQLEELIGRHEEFPNALMGEDGDGTLVVTSILEDRIVVERHLKDDRVCVQTWRPDGHVDEIYENRFVE